MRVSKYRINQNQNATNLSKLQNDCKINKTLNNSNNHGSLSIPKTGKTLDNLININSININNSSNNNINNNNHSNFKT